MAYGYDVVIGSSSRVVQKKDGRIFIPSSEVIAHWGGIIEKSNKIIFASYSMRHDDRKAIDLENIASWLCDQKCAHKTIFLSSDHVFVGNKGLYHARDKPDATEPYGLGKINIENILWQSKILRFTVFGPSNNEKPLLQEMLKIREVFDAISDQYFSPVSTHEVNQAIETAWEEDWQVCHLAGPRVSKSDWCRQFAKQNNLGIIFNDKYGLPLDHSLISSKI